MYYPDEPPFTPDVMAVVGVETHPRMHWTVSHEKKVLGLELQVEGERLRFFHGRAPLPEADEMIATLERMMEQVEARLEAMEARSAELEQQLAEEQRRREEAEHRLAEALAELERLRSGRS